MASALAWPEKLVGNGIDVGGLVGLVGELELLEVRAEARGLEIDHRQWTHRRRERLQRTEIDTELLAAASLDAKPFSPRSQGMRRREIRRRSHP